MVYSEIQDLCELRRFRISDIYRHLGMTYQGLKTSLDNGKLASDKVVLLCQKLSITPNEFFGWDKLNKNTYVNSNVQNGNFNTQNNATIDVLKQQLSVKDDQIKELLQLLKQK